MLVLVIAMLSSVGLAAAVILFAAFPGRGRRVPGAPPRVTEAAELLAERLEPPETTTGVLLAPERDRQVAARFQAAERKLLQAVGRGPALPRDDAETLPLTAAAQPATAARSGAAPVRPEPPAPAADVPEPPPRAPRRSAADVIAALRAGPPPPSGGRGRRPVRRTPACASPPKRGRGQWPRRSADSGRWPAAPQRPRRGCTPPGAAVWTVPRRRPCSRGTRPKGDSVW